MVRELQEQPIIIFNPKADHDFQYLLMFWRSLHSNDSIVSYFEAIAIFTQTFRSLEGFALRKIVFCLRQTTVS